MCPNGFLTDDKGCQISCTCKPRISACPFSCPHMSCPHGIESDANGCPLCRCNLPLCPETNCLNSCPLGFKKDIRGCATCLCSSHACSPLDCPATECAGTFTFETDVNGCNKNCTCKSNIFLCGDTFCSFFCLQPRKYFNQIIQCSCEYGYSGFADFGVDL